MTFEREGASIGEADMMGLAARDRVRLAQSFWTTVFCIDGKRSASAVCGKCLIRKNTISTHCDVMHEGFLLFAPQEPHQFGCDLDNLLGGELRCWSRKVGPLVKEATEILGGEVGSFGSGNDRDDGEPVEGAVAG